MLINKLLELNEVLIHLFVAIVISQLLMVKRFSHIRSKKREQVTSSNIEPRFAWHSPQLETYLRATQTQESDKLKDVNLSIFKKVIR